jgi:hypothetical protein
MMNLVYAFASGVLAWLGPSNKLTKDAFNYLRERAPSPEAYTDEETQAYELYIASPLKNAESNGLNEMFSRPYWTRLWILQELILAKQIIFMCGEDGLEWETLEHLPFASMDVKGTLSMHLPAQVHLHRSEWSRHGNRGRGMDKLFHLNTLIESFKRQQCSDARNKVFGLLALHRRFNTKAPVLAVDYSDTKEMVYKKVLEYVGLETPYMNCSERYRFTRLLKRDVLDVVGANDVVEEATQAFHFLHPDFRLDNAYEQPATCYRCLSPAEQIKAAEAQEHGGVSR